MDIGIGTDIEDIGRFRELSKEELGQFLTSKEMEYCFSKEDPWPYVAARFAGKEACIKAISQLSGWTPGFREIEIVHRSDGAPEVDFHGSPPFPLRVRVSLSHSGQQALAMAVAYR